MSEPKLIHSNPFIFTFTSMGIMGGLIGLIFITCFLFVLLRKASYSFSESLAILGILFANGLSVSSFNNVFAVFSLAVIISVDRESM